MKIDLSEYTEFVFCGTKKDNVEMRSNGRLTSKLGLVEYLKIRLNNDFKIDKKNPKEQK